MNIKNQRKLKKEITKISLIFASSIFLIVLILEIFLLWFQFFDYNNQEMQRLSFQADNFTRVINLNPDFEELINSWDFWLSWFGRPNWLQLKLEPKDWQWQRRIKLENFFIYDNKWTIVFSPFQDNDFYSEILVNINENNWKKFTHNWVEYFFINKKINHNLWAVFFVESRFTIWDSFKEFFEYFAFALLLALLIYYISYKFVSRSLKPVEENIADMEQFIHNAWHELKTPISVIKSTLELAQLKKEYNESIKDSITELDKMNDLIQVLISLSTINTTAEIDNINTNEIIKDSVRIFNNKIDEKHIKVDIKEMVLLELNCNKDYFKILFNNILNNAIKYNKPLWKINIIINKNSLEIKDNWIWISEDNIDKIFDRFYQESESREVNSFWIWLSLVKKIADIYWWEIVVTSQKWIWTTFIIKF